MHPPAYTYSPTQTVTFFKNFKKQTNKLIPVTDLL